MERFIEVNSREEIDNIVKEEEMVLVYIGGGNCSVCVDLKPKIRQLLDSYPKIKAISVDTEKNHNIAVSYTVFTIPGILVFLDGKESLREVRHISVQDLDSKINRYYNMIFE